MPTITISKAKLLRTLPKQFTDSEIENLLFDFGLELDSFDDENYKIEVPANRYDLLSLEGLSQALRIYLGLSKIIPLEITESRHVNKMYKPNGFDLPGSNSSTSNSNISTDLNIVYKDDNTDRPFIACAIINNIDLSETYDSLIDYQEILHQTLGRNRKILSIGTHDADKIRFPVYYRNVDNFKFAPLNTDYEIEDLKQHFGKDKKFRRYVEMISHYSVFTDSDANILSVPPVINSEYSRLTRNTKNVFIEITSHDLSRAIQALNYILYTFRGESVTYLEIVSNINGVNGIKSTVGRTIKDQVNKFFFTLDEINKELGLDLSPDKVSKYLERMMHKVEILSEDKIAVTVYGVRGDVLHKCDLIEDIAIAHGYNNFEFVPINISTIGSEDSLNKFSNKIRNELAMCGYIEVLLFTLVSARDLNFGTQENVALENPKSVEYGFVRNELISSLLKCVHANQHVSLPIKIFEVGDVVVLESRSGDKDKHDFTSTAVNKRKAGAMIAAKKDAFEEIQGLVTQIFKKCNLVVSYVETTRRGFVEKRCGQIVCEGEELGHFGIVELNVCRKMGVPLVCTAFEIDLRGLFRLFLNKN